MEKAKINKMMFELMKANNIVKSCPGKSGIEFSLARTTKGDIVDTGFYDTYWNGEKLGVQSLVFELNDDECLSDNTEDRYYIQFSVIEDETAVFFGYRLSEDFNPKDLNEITKLIKKLFSYVSSGLYSIDDLMEAVYKKVYTEDDMKTLRYTTMLCGEVVKNKIYPTVLPDYNELVAADKLDEYAPDIMTYGIKSGEKKITYTFTNTNTGIFFRIDGDTDELVDVGEMSNTDIYKEKLNTLIFALEKSKKRILQELPTFMSFIADDIKDDLKQQ